MPFVHCYTFFTSLLLCAQRFATCKSQGRVLQKAALLRSLWNSSQWNAAASKMLLQELAADHHLLIRTMVKNSLRSGKRKRIPLCMARFPRRSPESASAILRIFTFKIAKEFLPSSRHFRTEPESASSSVNGPYKSQWCADRCMMW